MQANVELLQHIPQFRELVEFKMKELEAGVWVEKNSSKTNLKLNPFVVLNGDLSAWEKLSKSFGPWFIGIEPSNTKLIQRKDLICLGETQCLTK